MKLLGSFLPVFIYSIIVPQWVVAQTSQPSLSEPLQSTTTATSEIRFSGHRWKVRTGYGGPGCYPVGSDNCNYWSDSTASVWVDGEGRLHLKIRIVGGIWYCAEVWTDEIAVYGTVRFQVIGRIDTMDPNIVVGLFLYYDDDNEIDIEFSRWSDPSNTMNGQYVVQPSGLPDHLHQFRTQLNGTHSTHYMDWQSSSLRFKSFHGHYKEPPNSGFLIQEWLYPNQDFPRQNQNLRVYINLWLNRHQAPSNNQEFELIISRVDEATPIVPNTWGRIKALYR